MIQLLDGPAAGVVLQLARAPFLLRVVKGAEWDALDQPGDEAAPDEAIFVYRLAGKPTAVHICRSPRRLSGWTAIADYRVLPVQPHDDCVRTTERWRSWADANMDALTAGTWADEAHIPKMPTLDELAKTVAKLELSSLDNPTMEGKPCPQGLLF